ncbi:MAG TPA: hypothetical protein VK611_19635 [Acidimicrobiales bacterium]|nr:hypothetical protein [Acidimicrobiales bacterium]
MTLEAVSLGLTSAVVLAFLAGCWRRCNVALGRIEGEMAALRREVTGYRAAHENMTESLDRRLLGLEQTSAEAAVELRMASDQLMGQRAAGPSAVGEQG